MSSNNNKNYYENRRSDQPRQQRPTGQQYYQQQTRPQYQQRPPNPVVQIRPIVTRASVSETSTTSSTVSSNASNAWNRPLTSVLQQQQHHVEPGTSRNSATATATVSSARPSASVPSFLGSSTTSSSSTSLSPTSPANTTAQSFNKRMSNLSIYEPRSGHQSPSSSKSYKLELPKDEYSTQKSPSVSFAADTVEPRKSVTSFKSRSSLTSFCSNTSGKGSYMFCERPDQGGVLGKSLKLKTNFYPIEIDYSVAANHYDVKIQYSYKGKDGADNVTNAKKDLNNLIIEQTFLQNQIGKNYIYDGEKNIYTVKDLFQENEKTFNVRVKIESEAEEKLYSVTCKHVGTLILDKMKNYITEHVNEVPKPEINLLNLAIRQNKLKTHKLEKNSTFSLLQSHTSDIDTVLCFSIGQYLSIKSCQNEWLQNSDMDSAVFYKDINLVDFASRFVQNVNKSLQIPEKTFLEKELKGLWIEQTITKRKYRVHELAVNTANEQVLSNKDEKNKETVAQYFYKKYKKTLQYAHLPLITVNQKPEPIYLPMELCKLVKGQRYKKQLTSSQQATIGKGTVLYPSERARTINELVKGNLQNAAFLKEFGIMKCNAAEMIHVPARVLDNPIIKFYETDRNHSSNKRWAPHNGLYHSKNLSNWFIIGLGSSSKFNIYKKQLANILFETLRSANIEATQPQVELMSHPRTIADIFNDLQGRLSANAKQIELVFFIIENSEQRDEIKLTAEKDAGFMTQCMKADKVYKLFQQAENGDYRCQNKLESYFSNLLLKVNVKTGGTNNVVQFEKLNIDTESTMIFGADVTHQVGDCLSIAAVVASMDVHFTRYIAQLSEQYHERENRKSKETVVNLRYMAIVLLKSYYKRNGGRYPNHLIFYRDGVDEGQFEAVLNRELHELQEACKEIEDTYSPKITFIIVQKRHHVRFFHTNQSEKNIEPGTVVDTHVTSRNHFDFFLCSHHAGQGTAQPTHYWVIYDQNHFSSDEIQQFTYAMCHLYAKTTKPVSIPAPVYYAHLAAFRGRSYKQASNKQRGNSLTLSTSRLSACVNGKTTKSIDLHYNIESTMFYT